MKKEDYKELCQQDGNKTKCQGVDKINQLGEEKISQQGKDKGKQQEEHYDLRQQVYAYWLHSVPGIGNRTISKLLANFENPETIFFLSPKILEPILKPSQIKNLLMHKKEWNLYTEFDKLEAAGIRLLPREHPDYPERLQCIPDAPEILYCKGNLPVETKLSIAIIGARQCSEYGAFAAEKFGRQLGAAGIQVISGLANGVDSMAQGAAVGVGGASFAVMGCGVDICYPAVQQNLYQSMQDKGGIISEFPPGTLPKPGNFPPRNRIISGLSDAVLVIEAKQKSGTFITVDMALEQGKEVYVLPGRITDVLSEGCNNLIRQGAGIALSPMDFIMQLTGKEASLPEEKGTLAEGTKQQKLVLEHLDFYPKSVDTIFAQMKEKGVPLTLPELIQQLMDLCICQLAVQISSNQYCRKSAEF